MNTPQAQAFLEKCAAAIATFAGNDVDTMDATTLALLYGTGTMTDVAATEDANGEELHRRFYGSKVKPLFTINAKNKSINFGSFGMPPCYISAVKQLHALYQDADSDAWVRLEGPTRYREMREAMANFINTPVQDGCGFEENGTTASQPVGAAQPDEVFVVDNVADGFNVIAKSFLCNLAFPINTRSVVSSPSTTATTRSIMYFANQYPSIKQAIKYYASLSSSAAGGAEAVELVKCDAEGVIVSRERADGTASCATDVTVTIRVFEIPMTACMVADEKSFVASVANATFLHKPDAFVVDHVCWAPTFVIPLKEVCAAVRAAVPSCFIVIDGAHAIGQISLAHVFKGCDNTAVPHAFDVYVSNCHKWLTCPRSAAIMWVASRHQQYLHPTIISNQYRGFSTTTPEDSMRPSEDRLLDRAHTSRAQAEFYWAGTRDMSYWMVLPDVIKYRSQCLGGEGNIMRHNKWLALEGANVCAKVWGTRLLFEDLASETSTLTPPQQGCLVCVRAPTASPRHNAMACRDVLEHNDTFAAPLTFDDKEYIRVSAQVYNSVGDYHNFAELYLAAVRRLEGVNA